MDRTGRVVLHEIVAADATRLQIQPGLTGTHKEEIVKSIRVNQILFLPISIYAEFFFFYWIL